MVLDPVGLQKGLDLPLLLLKVEIKLLELQAGHELFEFGHEAGQPLVVGLVEDELALGDLVAVHRKARLFVLRKNVVQQNRKLFRVRVLGLDEAERHFLEVLDSSLLTPKTGRIFLM